MPDWWSGIVVSTLALINEVNLRRTWLVLRWVIVSGSVPGAGHLFQYVTNQSPKANLAFHPYGVGKWVSALAGKANADIVYSVSGWTRCVQVKLWDPLRMRHIPEPLRGAVCSRPGAIEIHVYLTLQADGQKSLANRSHAVAWQKCSRSRNSIRLLMCREEVSVTGKYEAAIVVGKDDRGK